LLTQSPETLQQTLSYAFAAMLEMPMTSKAERNGGLPELPHQARLML
jgi:hypothetical protein